MWHSADSTVVAILTFFNFMGGAISASIAQNIFRNVLANQLTEKVPSINPAIVLDTGATDIRNIVPPSALQGVLLAYDRAVTRVFFLSIATGCVAFIFSFLMEWKSVKTKARKTYKDTGNGTDASEELRRLTLPPVAVDSRPLNFDSLFSRLEREDYSSQPNSRYSRVQ